MDVVFTKVKRFISKYWQSYLFITPSAFVLAIFFVFPLIYAIILSFGKLYFGQFQWVGLENYRSLFSNISTRQIFSTSLRNTAFYSLIMVPFQLTVALILASLIFELPPKVQAFFRSAFYLPVVCSAVIISLIWIWLYDESFGLMNYALSKVGLGPFQWIHGASRFPFSLNNSLFAIMLSDMVTAPGAGILFYLAAMSKLPRDLYEVAEIDGASKFQRWRWVTVPLLKPITLYLLVVQTIASFQVFDKILLMTSGGPGYTSTTLAYMLYERAFGVRGSSAGGGQFGTASVLGIILMILIGTLAVIQFKWLSSDVEY